MELISFCKFSLQDNCLNISIKAKSGSNLTELTKSNLVQSLKSFAVASVTPVIIDPETTFITLVTTFKFDSNLWDKTKKIIYSGNIANKIAAKSTKYPGIKSVNSEVFII